MRAITPWQLSIALVLAVCAIPLAAADQLTQPARSTRRSQPDVAKDVTLRPLSQIRLHPDRTDRTMPADYSRGVAPTDAVWRAESHDWSEREFNWEATDFFHQPTYFSDVPLERYGQTVSPALQPFISGTRFFLTFPVMPYKMGVEGTHERVYTLGLHRPGSPAPNTRQTIPWEWDAAAIEAAAWVAVIFIFP